MTDKDVQNDALLEKSVSRKQRLPPSKRKGYTELMVWYDTIKITRIKTSNMAIIEYVRLL